FGVAIQTDGKIVAGGVAGGSLALVRYLPNGSLDPSFGASGIVIVSRFTRAEDLVLQRDGKIVVAAGSYCIHWCNFWLARFDGTGSLDPTFGSDGVGFTPPLAQAVGLSLQRDGRIVVAGYANFTVARYLPDGTLDSSFGSNGVSEGELDSRANAQALVLESDGKVILGGTAGGRLAVGRFTRDGAPDWT